MQDDMLARADRIKRTVGEIQEVQNEITTNLDAQNEKLLKFHDHYGRIEGTLARTKTRIKYFQKSFFRDKVAMTLVCLILVAAAGCIAVLFLPSSEDWKQNKSN